MGRQKGDSRDSRRSRRRRLAFLRVGVVAGLAVGQAGRRVGARRRVRENVATAGPTETSLWLEGDGLTLSWSRIWDEVVNLNMVQSLH